LTLSTFIGYRGGKRNKNSWIAFFGILQGILAVLLAMINASDHYSFQRPSALVLATLGGNKIKIMNLYAMMKRIIKYLNKLNVIPQNIFSTYRYSIMRLCSRRSRKGTIRPVSLGENCSVVFAPSQHVIRKHSPTGSWSWPT